MKCFSSILAGSPSPSDYFLWYFLGLQLLIIDHLQIPLFSTLPMSIKKSKNLFKAFSSKLVLQIFNLVLNAEQQTFTLLLNSFLHRNVSNLFFPPSLNSAPNSQQKISLLPPQGQRSPSKCNSPSSAIAHLPIIQPAFPLDSESLSQPMNKPFNPEASSFNPVSPLSPQYFTAHLFNVTSLGTVTAATLLTIHSFKGRPDRWAPSTSQ